MLLSFSSNPPPPPTQQKIPNLTASGSTAFVRYRFHVPTRILDHKTHHEGQKCGPYVS
jgi:hypothetical protein